VVLAAPNCKLFPMTACSFLARGRIMLPGFLIVGAVSRLESHISAGSIGSGASRTRVLGREIG